MNINNYRQDKIEDITDHTKGALTIKENAGQGFIKNRIDLEK